MLEKKNPPGKKRHQHGPAPGEEDLTRSSFVAFLEKQHRRTEQVKKLVVASSSSSAFLQASSTEYWYFPRLRQAWFLAWLLMMNIAYVLVKDPDPPEESEEDLKDVWSDIF